MSENKQMAPYMKALEAVKPRFIAIAEEKPELGITWAQELGYAVQRIKQNKRLAECPPASISDSVVNVAATGLSLNPVLKHAYLVPRDGVCTLDISYMGLCHLAELSGAIRYVRADVVREGDNFVWKGLDDKPEHSVENPFSEDDRPIIGVYCYAYTSDGHYLAGKMSKKEIETVRKTSKAPNSPAWRDWYGEMAKKSIIKRESKLWPKAAREMVGQAIKVLNETDGLQSVAEHEAQQHYAEVRRKSDPDQMETSDDQPEPSTSSEGDVIEGDFEEVNDKPSGDGMQEATQRILARKLQAHAIGEDDLFRAMEVKGWEGLKQSDAAGCMEWINSEATA